MTASTRLSGEARRRRAGIFALLAAGVVALHCAALGGLRWTWDAPAAPPAPAVRVRAVVPVPLPVTVAAAPARDAPPRVRAPPAAAAPVVPRRVATAEARRPRAAPIAPASPDAFGAGRSDAAVDPASAADEDDPPPVYRALLPPSMTLRYDVDRAAVGGAGELRWRRDADGYALDWRGQAGAAALPTQSSRGGVDASGIAPLRFVDRRASRPALAVNFQRDVGRITFSRKAAAATLVPGAQDRLSWLLQLAAIVAGEPELRERGREVRMIVAGAGGDVAVWRLRCEGVEVLDGVDALRFVREPRGPYETRAEVWLAPRDGHYLPVQARWQSGPEDDGLALRLREAVAADAE